MHALQVCIAMLLNISVHLLAGLRQIAYELWHQRRYSSMPCCTSIRKQIIRPSCKHSSQSHANISANHSFLGAQCVLNELEQLVHTSGNTMCFSKCITSTIVEVMHLVTVHANTIIPWTAWCNREFPYWSFKGPMGMCRELCSADF